MSYAMNKASFSGLGQAEDSVDISRIPSAGTIKTKGGYSYQITPEDLLWLARSVQHEAGNNAATAWTYAQLLAMRRGSSLKSLVQAHSQPINPIWRRDGSKCRPGGAYHDRDECAERRLVVRDRAAAMPWSEIRPAIRETIVKFATARLPNPVPRAANFANAPVTTRYLLRHPSSAIVLREGNWYITESQTNSWPADFVTIEDEGRVAGPSLVGRARAATTVPVYVPGLAVLATGAAFAWWAYSKRGVRRNRRSKRRSSRRGTRSSMAAAPPARKLAANILPKWGSDTSSWGHGRHEGKPDRVASPTRGRGRSTAALEGFIARARLALGNRWWSVAEATETLGPETGTFVKRWIDHKKLGGLERRWDDAGKTAARSGRWLYRISP